MPASNPVNNYSYGVFGLNEARSLIITSTPTAVVGIATTTNVNTLSFVEVGNFSQDSTHGWFGSYITRYRIDFSNDSATASVRGQLSTGRVTSATGNSNYGWFAGGQIPFPTSYLSIVDRIDFSNDSSTASVRGPLSSVRHYMAATGNSNYGWFGGGYISGPTLSSKVDRIDFSNDSATASIRGSLSLARIQIAATGNSNYGWFGGGAFGPTTYSIVNRIDFSNDSSTASVRGPLSLAKTSLAATGNSNYGWFGGGNFPGITTVERIDFSNDSSTASVRGPLSLARSGLFATGNSKYGWFGGGQSPGPIPLLLEIDRIDFSNDSSTASVRGSLSSGINEATATSGQAKESSIKLPKGGNFGWIGGGNNPAATPTTISTVDRIDFSNDSSTASVRGSLSVAKSSLAATGNSNYGWFGGGVAAAYISTVDRIDFSNDSATASIRGPLSSARSELAATGNSNYGWFGGGNNPDNTPSSISIVDRIDFSNDSSTTSVRGPLSLARYSLAATGNSNYGWFGGGRISTAPGIRSTVNRIDFSNDSSTASVRGPLSLERYDLSATGNSNYGWFFGGQILPSPAHISVDRIDFSNDSATASVRTPLSQGRLSAGSTGNSNYGWLCGGSTSGTGARSIVNRIDFSNDAITSSFRGLLSSLKSDTSATSNAT